MRTTIELPDELLSRAKLYAVQHEVSLKELFIDALSQKLAAGPVKSRRALPVLGGTDSPRLGLLTAEQIDEAMFT